VQDSGGRRCNHPMQSGSAVPNSAATNVHPCVWSGSVRVLR
jgi:hypothetical protein